MLRLHPYAPRGFEQRNEKDGQTDRRPLIYSGFRSTAPRRNPAPVLRGTAPHSARDPLRPHPAPRPPVVRGQHRPVTGPSLPAEPRLAQPRCPLPSRRCRPPSRRPPGPAAAGRPPWGGGAQRLPKPFTPREACRGPGTP